MSNDGETEHRLLDEIYGCVNYLKIPYDTVMSMPVYMRKYWILRHNEQQEELKKQDNISSNGRGGTIEGVAVNSYAQMEQSNRQLGVPK